MLRISSSSTALAAALVAFAPAIAQAWDLVEGGFADTQTGYTPAALVMQLPDLTSETWVRKSINFTPRHRSSAWTLDPEREMSVRLDIGRNWGRLDYAAPAFRPREHDHLMVGGALQVDELAILGGVGRASLFGETADLVTAGMAFGVVQARVSVGETTEEVQGASDVMMFSTDLRISPWLTLQGDVALSERTDEEEPLAVGRVGVRLQF